MIKDNHIVIAGELTSKHTPDYRSLVDEVFDVIGKDRLGYDADAFIIHVLVSQQSPDIAQGVDIGGAGDQGMMFGYATNETPELLPMPFVLATRFSTILQETPARFSKRMQRHRFPSTTTTGKSKPSCAVSRRRRMPI